MGLKYVSLFSGIEAATVAWEPLGWEPLCFAEFDEFIAQLNAAYRAVFKRIFESPANCRINAVRNAASAIGS